MILLTVHVPTYPLESLDVIQECAHPSLNVTRLKTPHDLVPTYFPVSIQILLLLMFLVPLVY